MTRTLIEVDLDHIHDHPQNAHVCTARERRKIANNIRRTRQYPALTVRLLTEASEDYPGKDGHYQILDGHQRRLVFVDLVEEGLGQFARVLCDDWSPITDQEALVCLATLNSWGGKSPRRRAQLLHAIASFTDLRDAAQILPENEREIKDALKLKHPVPDIKRLIDQTEAPDLIVLTFVVGNQQKAAMARFTAAAQLFATYYGATVTNVDMKEGGERGRIAIFTFEIQNAARAIVDEALKRAGAGLPPGTKNKRGRSLQELASAYLAQVIEHDSKVPLAEIEKQRTTPPDLSTTGSHANEVQSPVTGSTAVP